MAKAAVWTKAQSLVLFFFEMNKSLGFKKAARENINALMELSTVYIGVQCSG